jgi:hypothetical protein
MTLSRVPCSDRRSCHTSLHRSQEPSPLPQLRRKAGMSAAVHHDGGFIRRKSDVAGMDPQAARRRIADSVGKLPAHTQAEQVSLLKQLPFYANAPTTCKLKARQRWQIINLHGGQHRFPRLKGSGSREHVVRRAAAAEILRPDDGLARLQRVAGGPEARRDGHQEASATAEQLNSLNVLFEVPYHLQMVGLHGATPLFHSIAVIGGERLGGD